MALTRKIVLQNWPHIKYKWVKDVVGERDDFIAKTIKPWATARRNCFHRRCHNIRRAAPGDPIIKDALLGKEYQELPLYHRNKERVAQLAQYLTARITEYYDLQTTWAGR